jgi:hypothetical protein
MNKDNEFRTKKGTIKKVFYAIFRERIQFLLAMGVSPEQVGRELGLSKIELLKVTEGTNILHLKY